MYKNVIKRFLDIVISSVAIVLTAIPMLIICIAIKIDDPGPVFFKQLRVGQKKNGKITYFMVWKFRSMKMSAPHDVPTHLLNNANQHITRVGRFIRKTSLDELPQIYQVFTSKLSIVGPRPVIISEGLTEEREKYGANDVKPGITGWAQINGRDKLGIPEKAKLDGEYVAALNSGFIKGFMMDTKCFFGTFIRVIKAVDVIEGRHENLTATEKEKEKEKEVVFK